MTNMPVGTEQVRPDAWYYLLSLLPLALAIGLALYFLHTGVPQIRENMVRMDVPGELNLDLSNRETYTIFVERATSRASKNVDLQPLAQIHCDVHNAVGEGNQTNPRLGTAMYTYGMNVGVSILDFEVNKNGTYNVACQGPSEISGDKIQVAIGGGSAKALTAVTSRCIVSLIGGIVIGILILIRVFMLRQESIRDIRDRGLRPM
ncbi:MAG TPA: hypothetical protein VMH20_13385 [Verrucomicrobiae bacterium]|nr:hypothetical protein [Verrucomicrobiae bacterium]